MKFRFTETMLALALIGGSAHGQSRNAYGRLRCSPSSLAGRTWGSEQYKYADSVTFINDDSFEYTVREGARTVVQASGRFSLQQSGKREPDRWPSGCMVTFEPTKVEKAPSDADLAQLQDLGRFDGSRQTFWVELWDGKLLLLNRVIAENDPASTKDMLLDPH
jgi:hypothetical protein